MGVAEGDFQRRRLPGPVRHLRRAEPAVPERRPRNIRRYHREGAGLGGSPGFRQAQRCGSISTGTGLLDLFVCNYVKWSPGTGRVLQHGWQAEAILHSRGIPRRDLLAVPQPGKRHVRRRDRVRSGIFNRARSRSAPPCSTTTGMAGSDLFVANDTEPNKLSTQPEGTASFEDAAVRTTAWRSAGMGKPPGRRGHGKGKTPGDSSVSSLVW